MQGVLGATLGVGVRALHLVWRHWPTLLVLWLLGWIGSEWMVRLAVEATSLHNVAGMVVLALAPVASMAAMVVSLRALRTSSSLPRPAPTDARGAERVVCGLDSIGSVLAPFLAVYLSQGALRELVRDYTNRANQRSWEEALVAGLEGRELPANWRGLPAAGWVLGALALVAFVVRWILRRRKQRKISSGADVPLAWGGAWLEAVWLMVAVQFVNVWRHNIRDWIADRRVIHAVSDAFDDVTGRLGVFGDAAQRAWGWVFGWLGDIDKLVIAPLGLLTVGAVVYGAALAVPEGTPLPGADLVRERFGERWTSVPRRLHRPVTTFARPVRERFQPLVDGLRLIARSGLVPMMVFCVAYAGSQTLSRWLYYAARRTIGPRPLATSTNLDPVLGLAAEAVAGVLTVALIGAAIERLVAAASAAVDEQVEPVTGASAEA